MNAAASRVFSDDSVRVVAATFIAGRRSDRFVHCWKGRRPDSCRYVPLLIGVICRHSSVLASRRLAVQMLQCPGSIATTVGSAAFETTDGMAACTNSPRSESTSPDVRTFGASGTNFRLERRRLPSIFFSPALNVSPFASRRC